MPQERVQCEKYKGVLAILLPARLCKLLGKMRSQTDYIHSNNNNVVYKVLDFTSPRTEPPAKSKNMS